MYSAWGNDSTGSPTNKLRMDDQSILFLSHSNVVNLTEFAEFDVKELMMQINLN